MEKPKHLLIDVDGVITDGSMIYSHLGKQYKVFGPDDVDALNWLHEIDPKLEIVFVSADHRGFEISKKRVEDMHFQLIYMESKDRAKKAKELGFDLENCIYIGDGFNDANNFKHFGYKICPSDGFYATTQEANYVTYHGGGKRCLAEACIHIAHVFYNTDF